MSIEQDIIKFNQELDAALLNTLEAEVADAARDEISQQLGKYVFPYSRGETGLGLLDKRNFEAIVSEDVGSDTFTLEMEDVALFQSDYGKPGELADAVTYGTPAFRMPGPRPFMQPAEEELGKRAFEDALAEGLKRRGF